MRLVSIRAKKLAHALLSNSGRRALRFGVAASIEHEAAFRNYTFRTIVDVGANVGQFALFALKRFPKATIYSFEPLEDCWNKFDSVIGPDTRVRLYRYGIGQEDSTSLINVTNENDSSSILTPSGAQEESFGTVVVERKNIELRRLASLLTSNDLVAPALLKIDVQGFELDVLKGSKELLNCFDCIYVEASYVELYRYQALAGDVVGFLQENGFEMRGVFNQYADNKRGPLQADFLFAKTDGTSTI